MYPGGGVIFRSDTTSNRRQTTEDRKGQRRTPHSKPPQESPNPTLVLSNSPLRKRKLQQGNKEQGKETYVIRYGGAEPAPALIQRAHGTCEVRHNDPSAGYHLRPERRVGRTKHRATRPVPRYRDFLPSLTPRGSGNRSERSDKDGTDMGYGAGRTGPGPHRTTHESSPGVTDAQY